MSGTTTREPGTTRRAGDTLPRQQGPEPRRTRTALLSVVGSLLLLVGVPVALVLGVGNPLPTEAPTADWLTVDVDASMVIDVLAVLVWIVWVHFVVCFLTEWRALRAGRMPSRVVMGGGSQTLARQLVAGVLLLSGGASIASGLSSLAAEPADTATSTGPSVVQTVERQVVLEQTAEAAKAEQSTSNQSTKHYDVKPPQGRNHDTLWDIADRTLGDPFRWKEIFELNKDRLQPDGRRLVDADLIMPGWQLRLPGDARGAGVQITKATVPGPAAEVREAGGSPTGSQTGAQADSQTGTQAESRTDARGGAEGGAGGAGGVGAAATTVDSAERPGDASNAVEALLLGGGLVLAGVLRALTARRGPFGEPQAAEAELARIARQRRADLVDDALRGLAEQRDAADEPMPEVIFAYVDDEQVVLHLARSASAPEQPWTTSEDGMSWTLRAEDLQTPGTGVVAPYPCLVNVAESHGYDLLVDLEMAPGLVALGGDTTVAREVAMSIAVDLATHRWSDDVRVTMVGFGDELADIAGDRIRRTATLDEALEAASAQAATAGSVADSLGVRGVLSGRLRGAGRELTPTVLLLSGPPTAEQSRQLSRLTSGGRTNLAVVAIGDSPSARWRFVLDTSGHLDAGVLGVRGEARRLTREGQQQLGSLLEAAVQRKRDGESLVDAAPSAGNRAGATDGVPAGAASAAAESVQVVSAAGEGPTAGDLERAAVRVRLLGPVAVTAPGPLDEAKRDLLTEVVVIASLHPDGLHEAVLKASLWPRGVEADVVEARLADVQAWLGDDAQGRPRLARGEDGRWHLADDVVSDYAVLVAAARATGGRELDALLGALATGTGEVFTGTASRYGWFAFAKEARACRVLVATCARRAAGLASGAGDPARAEEALELGLALVPAAEVLWRDRLRLVSDVEPGRVPGLVHQMYSTLAERGVRHEPETDALVAEIAPDLEGVVGG